MTGLLSIGPSEVIHYGNPTYFSRSILSYHIPILGFMGDKLPFKGWLSNEG
jgi:hypothetical protein